MSYWLCIRIALPLYPCWIATHVQLLDLPLRSVDLVALDMSLSSLFFLCLVMLCVLMTLIKD